MSIARTDPAADTTLFIESERAQEISKFLNDFERLRHDFKGTEWGLLHPLINPVGEFRDGVQLIVTLTNGAKIQGELVYVDADILLLAPEGHCKTCHPEDVSPLNPVQPALVWHVRDRYSYLRRFFKEIDIYDAGSVEAHPEYTLQVLDGAAVFGSVLPPEIRLLEAPIEHAFVPVPRYINRIRFSASTDPFVRHFSFPESTDKTSGGGLRQDAVPPRGLLSVEADYSLSNRWRLGAQVQFMAGSPVRNVDWDHITMTAYAGSALATFIIIPLDPVAHLRRGLVASPHNIELHLGAGISYALWQANYVRRIRILTPEPHTIHEVVTSIQRSVGATAKAGLDFYLTRRISIMVGSQIAVFPDILISSPDWPNTTVQKMDDRVKAIVTGRASLGLRFHLPGGL